MLDSFFRRSLVAATVAIFCQSSVAEVPAVFENAVEMCRSLLFGPPVEFALTDKVSLKGREIWQTPFGFGSSTGEGYDIQYIRPVDGRGRVLLLTRPTWASWQLGHLVVKFADYFQRFGIYADDTRLVMPDAERLNSFNTGGVQFADVPVYRRQRYSDRLFDVSFAQGFIPLASRGRFFFHDRMQEHLIGALVLPPWLYKLARIHTKYIDALNSSAEIKRLFQVNGQKPIPIASEMTSDRWDQMTGKLGAMIYGFDFKVTGDRIRDFANEFLYWADRFQLKYSTVLGISNLGSELRFFEDNRELRLALLQETKRVWQETAPSLSEEVTLEFAIGEAVRILSDVTGLSQAELHAILIAEPKRYGGG